MKQAKISELKENLSDYLKMVEEGETVQVMNGDQPVAEIRRLDRVAAPREQASKGEIDLDDLEARGIIRRGKRKIPPEFFTAPRGIARTSIVDALIEDREDRC